MSFSEYLVERIRRRFTHIPDVEEKKMIGGLIFMVHGKMCIGVDKDRETEDDHLMARVGENVYDTCLKQPGARRMDFTGRPMKGFIFVYADGIDSEESLDFWTEKALEYNRSLPFYFLFRGRFICV